MIGDWIFNHIWLLCGVIILGLAALAAVGNLVQTGDQRMKPSDEDLEKAVTALEELFARAGKRIAVVEEHDLIDMLRRADRADNAAAIN